MKKISRRSFLMATGVIAASAALSACGGSSASTSSAGSTAASTAASGTAEEMEKERLLNLFLMKNMTGCGLLRW